MSVDIVIGLGYGDEGKGRVVDSLATPTTTVIRFNGGHQAGHTVVTEKNRHVFSTFGSGTFKGAETYITKYCTFYPTAFINEFNALKKATGMMHGLCVDSEAMLTTPFDVEINKRVEKDRGNGAHGSVGVGFGNTIGRHEKHKLFVRDMMHPAILRNKLKCILKYYYTTLSVSERDIEDFIKVCAEAVEIIDIVDEGAMFAQLVMDENHLIFEGAQGVMLDMDYGFFPHVTRSHTTSRNAIELIKKYELIENVTINYVTRAYSTRHGNGPFDEPPIILKNTERETNLTNTWQGQFKTGELNIDSLVYAVDCDRYHSSAIISDNNLFITCVDQLTEELELAPLEIGRALRIRQVYTSHSEGPEPFILQRHQR
jgi:adenylosuccinate synthase